MQQKERIDMFLFGERSPLVSESQVEDNMFAIEEIGTRVENENDVAMTKQNKQRRKR